MNTPRTNRTLRQLITKEMALICCFLFFGLLILPIIIYSVGELVFDNYAGHGYGDFFDAISKKVRNGNYVAWLLVMSPYIGWQSLRLTLYLWRLTGSQNQV